MINFLFLLLGVGLLTIGGEALIRGSLAASRRLGVSPLLSGLVIVGFGTSAPELVVSVNAALNQQPDIAIGNVVGSNIGNVLLILGICALIAPMTIKPLALRRDAFTVVAASFLFLVLVGGSALGRGDGVFLLIALIAYLVWAFWSERNNVASAQLNKAEAEEVHELPKSVGWTVTAVIIGLLLLISGSQILLIGAVGIAKSLGVSEAVIGLTLVAVGTSLPELSISVIAALRRHADVAVGNILGSNIFNLFGILGVSALLQPLPVHVRILQFDQWVMLGSSLLLFLFLYSGRSLSRLEGGVLLTAYGVYVGFSFIVFDG
ncbi:calcium/sodium antiporter [uncultured Paraglaciecola sp.]|uniref:calcium/sodium antiporter n=1 Tax=uncultured Paraglaciecola sp. TaxID=1765024 RepID=UPI0030DBE888|tara:strand:- start:2711 stop:3670 length:960 start_codon:yes stop_codon:yes gene_type:complete